jgi:hypothetical protein
MVGEDEIRALPVDAQLSFRVTQEMAKIDVKNLK